MNLLRQKYRRFVTVGATIETVEEIIKRVLTEFFAQEVVLVQDRVRRCIFARRPVGVAVTGFDHAIDCDVSTGRCVEQRDNLHGLISGSTLGHTVFLPNTIMCCTNQGELPYNYCKSWKEASLGEEVLGN